MNVFITGIGCISPLGFNMNENLNSLKKSISGLKKTLHFKSRYSDKFFYGEVNANDETLREMSGLQNIKGLTRTDMLAFKAFAEAIDDAKLTSKEISAKDTAFISATTVGGMCLTDQLYNDSNLKSDTKEFLGSYSGAAHALQIAKKYGIKGHINTINTACSSSANAILFGARLINSGRVKRAVVGGVDSLSKYTVNGFNSLQILSDEKCKAFDKNRKGLNLGEGAGYIVLEDSKNIHNKKVYAKFAGYGNSNDAFHSSSMSEEATGIISAIEQALNIANIKAEKIDYINAHGTGTQNNDFVELAAFSKVFHKVPPFSSNKTFIGHTLGAAGIIEGIFSVLSILNREIYPNLNFEEPIQEFNLIPVVKLLQNIDINYVMSNSYGFGGNCTSLIFEKV